MTNARNVLENISHKARKEAAMIYQKVSADMKFVDREKEVEKFWKDNDIFQKSIDNRKEGPTYTFYDGPPTANGIQSHKGTFVSSAASATIGQILILIT